MRLYSTGERALTGVKAARNLLAFSGGTGQVTVTAETARTGGRPNAIGNYAFSLAVEPVSAEARLIVGVEMRAGKRGKGKNGCRRRNPGWIAGNGKLSV